MVFEGGATAAFTMNAFTPEVRRETRICGSFGRPAIELGLTVKITLSHHNTHSSATIE